MENTQDLINVLKETIKTKDNSILFMDQTNKFFIELIKKGEKEKEDLLSDYKILKTKYVEIESKINEDLHIKNEFSSLLECMIEYKLVDSRVSDKIKELLKILKK